MRIIYSAALATTAFATMAFSNEVTSSTQALTIALEAASLSESDTVRLQSMESSLFRNGFQDWTFVLRDGATVHDVDVAQNGDAKVETETDPDGDNPAFWSALPAPAALETIEDRVTVAKAELTAFETTATLRDQYLFEYEICDVPDVNETDIGSNGCKDGDTLQEWSVVLKADVPGNEFASNYVVVFEDGVQTQIARVRVGGNW